MSIFNTRSFIIGVSIATVGLVGCDTPGEEPEDIVTLPAPGGTQVIELEEMQVVAEQEEWTEDEKITDLMQLNREENLKLDREKNLAVGIDTDANEVVSVDEVDARVDRVEIVEVDKVDSEEDEIAANENAVTRRTRPAVNENEGAPRDTRPAVNEDEFAANEAEDEVQAMNARDRDDTNDIWAPDTEELSDASPEDTEQLEPFAGIDTNEDTTIAVIPIEDEVDEPMSESVDEPTSSRADDRMIAEVEVDEPVNTRNLLAPFGMAFSVGGSLNDFTDGGARDFTAVGGGWEARYILGTRTRLAGEAAYIGTANGIDALGVEDNAVLMSNGVEGLLRVNILTQAWQPYLAAGLGWKRYNVVNTDVNTSDIRDEDDALIVPLAAGLAYRFSNVFADVRMNVKPSFLTDITSTGNDSDVALHSYGGQLNLGFEF